MRFNRRANVIFETEIPMNPTGVCTFDSACLTYRHVKTIPAVMTVTLLFLAIGLFFSVEARSAFADGNVNVQIAGPDTWGAIDALGRVLPHYRTIGPPRKNKSVGIFYFTAYNHPAWRMVNGSDTIPPRRPD